MADGIYYHDTKEPIIAADQTAVTLALTAKALVPAAAMPVLGQRYFDRIGKKIRIRLAGRITTALTPGNGQFVLYWGSGADAIGTIIASGPANALIASQTNLTWVAEFEIECRALGATGSLLATGYAMFNEAVSVAHQLIPASAPAAVVVDLTAASIVSVQFLRSGSTVETMQVHQVTVTALN